MKRLPQRKYNLSRKILKPTIRPFKGSMFLNTENETDIMEFIAGMGYLVYEDPTGSGYVIISDKVLTYGDLKKNAKKFGIDLKWWNEHTDFNDRIDEELDEACI
jgi:hypothetical protein